MFGKEKKPVYDQIEVSIGPKATMSGHLRCDGSIRIEGVVESGILETPSNIVITATGRVAADVHAHTISIAGVFRGNINAHRVELLEGGRIWGEVRVNSFMLDEGGYLRGNLIMQGNEPPEPFLLPRPSESESSIPVLEAGEARIEDGG